MKRPHMNRRSRMIVAATGTLTLVGAAAAAAQTPVAATDAGPLMAKHVVITSGLDNPRQLQRLENGDFLVAEAGHGGNNPNYCRGPKGNETCIGITGKVTRIHGGIPTHVITGLLSAAGKDGSFATGSDGASHQPKGPYLSIMTYAPEDELPPGLPTGQLGRLLAKYPGGKLHPIGNISALERAQDPDGEGFDSNPYSVLALKNQTLVADAAGDYIASVKDGHVSLWATLPEYGPKYDAVPTSLSRGPHGKIYVGELHSELKHKARVWQYDRMGNRERSWTGFTTVTGAVRGGDGSLYVSELFGGTCTFEDIPTCFPGRVVRVAPDGTRTHVNVPFPAGIATHVGKVYVNAFSISPTTGFGGNPEWSGQLWQVFP